MDTEMFLIIKQLSYRTDFYCEITSPADKIGFPPGVNEQIVLKTLRKWKNNVIKAANEIPVAYEREITTTTDDELTASSDNVPENPNTQNDESRSIFDPAEFYNGACFPKYCWTQSINEIGEFIATIHLINESSLKSIATTIFRLELCVRLPYHIRTSKHLRVNIDQSILQIIDQSTQAVILNDKLARKWKASEANWTLAGNKLQISVDKMSEAWWEKLFVSEPQLDTTKLNCSRPIEDLSQDTQAMIRKMQWDNQQEQLGNPSSKERTNLEMLQKAWNVEGSPFKDTPFDPNVVTFQN